MKNIFLICLAAGFLFMSGCSVIQREPPSSGIPSYSLGDLLVMVNKPVPDVWKATVAGYKELGIELTKSKSDSLTGKVEGKLANGDIVVTDLKSVNPQRTDVSIKVGSLGNKDYSYTIWSSIQKHL
ncbi:MAG: DUF3568 family protein [Nitrospiraceae bacterium]|nr:DUF3568 family protein [Nitrospiraceae bacterium]